MTVKRTPVIFDAPAESGNIINSVDGEENIYIEVKDSEFNIFNSKKYKALKEENKIDNQDTVVGRRNPFEL